MPMARGTKDKINGLNQNKNFCTPKETSIKMKREFTVWEDIFANGTPDKGLISNT